MTFIPFDLNIALAIRDQGIAKQISSTLSEISYVKIERIFENSSIEKPTGAETIPDLIILDDHPEGEKALFKINLLRNYYEQTPMFVISSDTLPEHIIEIMKAGAAEFFFIPLDPQAIKTAVEKVRTNLHSTKMASKGRVYSFISSKGGLGTTVVAVNTAVGLTKDGNNRVALIDMSLQSGDSSTLLDVVPQATLADLCSNYHRLDFSFLQGAMTKHPTGLHFLAAPADPEYCATIQAEHIKKILDLAKDLYDNVVIDCTSMSITASSLEAFKASDKIFVLTDLSVPAIRNASRLVELMRKKGISADKIEFSVTRFIKGNTLSLSEIEENLKKRIFWLFPNDFENTVSSINRGVPLIDYQPKTSLARNVFEFVEKLKNPAGYGGYRGLKGLFGKTV